MVAVLVSVLVFVFVLVAVVVGSSVTREVTVTETTLAVQDIDNEAVVLVDVGDNDVLFVELAIVVTGCWACVDATLAMVLALDFVAAML